MGLVTLKRKIIFISYLGCAWHHNGLRHVTKKQTVNFNSKLCPPLKTLLYYQYPKPDLEKSQNIFMLVQKSPLTKTFVYSAILYRM